MTTTLAIVKERLPIAQDPEGGPQRLIAAFLERRSVSTRRAYQADLADFAAYVGTDNPAEAIRYLIARGPGPANEVAMNYKGALAARGLSAGTVNRRLSTLRSALKMARTVGLCTFGLEIESERRESYRDTRGPGVQRIKGMVGQLQARGDAGCRQAVRDLAIVRLLFDMGLRRGEAVSLDVEHYDREGCRLHIHGKGRDEREWVTVPPAAKAAVDRWLALRGEAPGPMFTQCDRLAKVRAGEGRLSGTAIWYMLRRFNVRPHGLRHTAITEALRITNGDIPEVMGFSRHKSPQVLMVYNDRRKDAGGKVAAMLGALV